MKFIKKYYLYVFYIKTFIQLFKENHWNFNEVKSTHLCNVFIAMCVKFGFEENLWQILMNFPPMGKWNNYYDI